MHLGVDNSLVFSADRKTGYMTALISHGLTVQPEYCKLPENSDLILQIYSARRSIDLALFISFSRFMYICLYKADIIVYNYPVVLLRDAVIPA